MLSEAGTTISVISTLPGDTSVQSLIILSIGDTSWAMSLDDSRKVVHDLRSKAQGHQEMGGNVVLQSGDAVWEMSSEAALRVAEGIEGEILKVLARE